MRQFSQDFQNELYELMKWRRDVRHFKPDAIEQELLQKCLSAFEYAPSVGLSEPWRIVDVASAQSRQKVLENFQTANENALKGYDGDQAKLYTSLKLSGMKESPVQLAVFCDEQTQKGSGLGAQTMPEMRRYSVVTAIMSFWLTARAMGLGVGWVSIIDPTRLISDLNLTHDWSLVAYLCVGWPKEESTSPELETVGWESRDSSLVNLIKR